MDAEPFRPGDTIVLPFLIVADGAIVNISDGIVTARVDVQGGAGFELDAGDIAIEQAAPVPSDDPEDQVAHGTVTISAERTAGLPLGPQSALRIFYINSAGVRMHVPSVLLKGMP